MTDSHADVAALREHGFVVLPELLAAESLGAMRAALAPELEAGPRGRNNFEGHRTQRVYSLVGRGRIFEDLVEHPRILAICDALLLPNYLLTASQAIQIHPGETPQPFHTDDAFYRIPRPRPAVSVSTMWAVDAFTASNGATQVVPGSHRWSDERLERLLERIDFATRRDGSPVEPETFPLLAEAGEKPEPVLMPPGSVMVFLGTLLHRGGANRSRAPRLALSNQYCEPWARQQESYVASIPAERARRMSRRVQDLLGYSIHPPFMGHVLGRHPRRLLREEE